MTRLPAASVDPVPDTTRHPGRCSNHSCSSGFENFNMRGSAVAGEYCRRSADLRSGPGVCEPCQRRPSKMRTSPTSIGSSRIWAVGSNLDASFRTNSSSNRSPPRATAWGEVPHRCDPGMSRRKEFEPTSRRPTQTSTVGHAIASKSACQRCRAPCPCSINCVDHKMTSVPRSVRMLSMSVGERATRVQAESNS